MINAQLKSAPLYGSVEVSNFDSSHLVALAEKGEYGQIEQILKQMSSEEKGLKVYGEYKGSSETGTFLHYAAAKGDLRLCQLLLAHGFDVNARDAEEGSKTCEIDYVEYPLGNRPLHKANFSSKLSREHQKQVIERLVDIADFNIQNEAGQTPIMHWRYQMPINIRYLSEILLTPRTISGESVFRALQKRALVGRIFKKPPYIDFNLQDKNGNSTLHYLMKTPRLDEKFIEYALRHGADCNLQNDNEQTPMHFLAVHLNDISTVFKLCKGKNPDLDIVNRYRETPRQLIEGRIVNQLDPDLLV